jgi:hypothetical protein
MHVDVVNGLARTRIHVAYGAITLLMDIRLHRQFLGYLKHLADKRIIVRHEVIQRGDVLSGDDQQVHGSLRPEVFK